jgi:2,3-bisphosphoglycerate-independent phosphoglycerate mutase
LKKEQSRRYTMMMQLPRPVMLVIMDGWGYREATEHNAIHAAHTPIWDDLWAHYPKALLSASEGDVGLPEGQMGNSEVGHMNIGAGRVMMQDLPRIDHAIHTGELAKNPDILNMIAKLKASGGACHLMGLLSDGGVHAHANHIHALAKIVADAGVSVWLHAFLDGRDTPPKSAEQFLHAWEELCAANPLMRTATICGRYYAMDRDKRWDRVERAFNAIAYASCEKGAHSINTLKKQYEQGIKDEFILPTAFNDYTGIQQNDGLIMCNFRADRAREILHPFVDETFISFDRPTRPALHAGIIGMVEYSAALSPLLTTIFPQEIPAWTLGEVLARRHMRQLRIAETEKYAHVTFFFNGGREVPFEGEDRILVPSPDVATYDLQPEMSAPQVTQKLVEAIESGIYDLIVVNYANTDMVGHTGNITAAMRAVEAVDTGLKHLKEALDKVGGVMLISADHGNAEMMHDNETGQAHTAHTLELVPVVLYGTTYRDGTTRLRNGVLADLAPTLLHLMHIPQPSEMTGTSLIAS